MCDNNDELLRRSQAVRLVAFILMLLAGVEVLACDLVSPDFCKLSNGGGGSSSDSSGSGSSGDNCLCCCTHYSAPSTIPATKFTIMQQLPDPRFIVILIPARPPLDHPPRS